MINDLGTVHDRARPGECQIACQRLVDIFIAEAEAVELIALLLDVEDGEHGWLSALVSLDGDDDWADRWAGTIQWTCVSPIRQGWKRKNWFIGVSVLRPPDAQSTVREWDCDFKPSGRPDRAASMCKKPNLRYV